MRQIGHWVEGRSAAGASGRVAPVYDPARGIQTGEVALASAAEVDAVVASSVEAVMAQRLIRTICSHCKEEQKVDRAYLTKIGFPEADIETAKVWRGAGCEECRQLGYQGRKGIYELLLVTEALRPLIMNRAPATTIAARAIEAGMRTLRIDGWNKVKAGVTTIEEVMRVTQMEEHMASLIEGEAKQFTPRA